MPVDVVAPALARAALARLTDELPERAAADLLLLTTEVVSNAVRHTGMAATDEIILRLVADDFVHVEVLDQGPGFGPRPHGERPMTDETRGWGLFLVDRLAQDWGAGRENGCTKVWFDLDPAS